MRSATRVPGWVATEGTSNIVITDAHKDGIFEELMRTHPDINQAMVTLRSIRGFRRLHFSSSETLVPGDSVHLLFNDEPAWALLREPFVEATWGSEVLLFAFPVWFTARQRADRPQFHSLRGTVLLTSYLAPHENAFLQPPVEVNTIVERVLVVHSCKRDCAIPGHVNCRCEPNCYVRHVCHDHRAEQCAFCPAATHFAEDHHNPVRHLYEVLSPRTNGIHFHKNRSYYNDQ
jgi:hypothetical protein